MSMNVRRDHIDLLYELNFNIIVLFNVVNEDTVYSYAVKPYTNKSVVL